MVDQEQTTTTEATDTTQSQTQDAGSSTSTTETQTEESIDLGQTGESEEQTEETQTEETDEEKAQREEREALFGAPAEGESYQIEEGVLPKDTVLDEEALKAIEPEARKLGLSNKGFSTLVGAYAEKVLPRVAQQVTTQIEQQVVAQRSAWEGEARDAIAGKAELLNAAGEKLDFKGMDMKAVRAEAAKALDKLAPQGFRKFLDETGLGVHPAMVAFAFNAGQLVAEDREIEDTDTTNKKSSSSTRKSGGMHPERFYNR